MATAKQELENMIAAQPEDATKEELVRELAFQLMVERGLSDSDNNRTISNEDVRQRINAWQK